MKCHLMSLRKSHSVTPHLAQVPLPHYQRLPFPSSDADWNGHKVTLAQGRNDTFNQLS